MRYQGPCPIAWTCCQNWSMSLMFIRGSKGECLPLQWRCCVAEVRQVVSLVCFLCRSARRGRERRQNEVDKLTKKVSLQLALSPL